jgi:hypothetical protein
MIPSSGLPTLAQRVQGEGEQDGHEQHLQDLALGEGADHGRRDDVHQELDRALLAGLGGVGLDRRRIERRRVDVHPGTRLPQVDHDQADHQGHRGHDLEVDQRLQPDPADLLHVAHAGDAVHHRAEDDGRDQHLISLMKASPSGFISSASEG